MTKELKKAATHARVTASIHRTQSKTAVARRSRLSLIIGVLRDMVDKFSQKRSNRTAKAVDGDRRLIEAIAGVAAPMFGAKTHDVLSIERGGKAASDARMATAYVAHVTFNWPLRRVGLALGRKHPTCAHACETAEMRRDDPAYDGLMARLEIAARAIADGMAITRPVTRTMTRKMAA